jgi:hypothetical protein
MYYILMYITKTKDTYKLWTNDRRLLSFSKSRLEMDYILFRYNENKRKEQNNFCMCLVCKIMGRVH